MKLIKNSKKYQIDDMLWEMIRSRFLEDNGIRIIDKNGEYFSDNFNNYFNDLCGLDKEEFLTNITPETLYGSYPYDDYEELYEVVSFNIKTKKKFNAVKTKFGFDCKDQEEFDKLESFKIDPVDLIVGMETFNWHAVPIE